MAREIIFIIPAVFLYFYKHKLLLVIAIMAGVAMVGIGTFNRQREASNPTPAYQYDIPATKYQGVTAASIIYIDAYETNNGMTTLTSFYSWDDNKWVKQKLPLPIPSDKIRIIPR